MRRSIPSAILFSAAAFLLLAFAGASGAQPVLAAGADAEVTDDGLHRVDPSIMEAAWVGPEFDLSRYTRILLMPTAVHFRDVPKVADNARSRTSASQFPLNDDRKEWFRGMWTRAVDAQFAREESYELFHGVAEDVLVVQGFLVDVVARIPPDSVGSNYTFVRDPWSATVVLELRDPMTTELVARTIDRRHAQGLLEAGEVWYRTENLVERWAQVLAERLQQLSDLGGRDSRTPDWARSPSAQ